MQNPNEPLPNDHSERFDRLEKLINGSQTDNRAHAMLALRQIDHHMQAINASVLDLERRLLEP